ncbi:MAG: hypothetical protein OS130_08115 [Thermodesulfobacteriota bacterium]|nr:MAG: hypothetical protein OS130_08115 [Thermodesulfobacteriota bacterium]
MGTDGEVLVARHEIAGIVAQGHVVVARKGDWADVTVRKPIGIIIIREIGNIAV